MLRLSLSWSALMVVLGVARPTSEVPAPATLVATDTVGQSWTMLAPPAQQFDVLFFVASDCPISNRYAPEMARVCSDYKSRGVRCFFVYPDEGADPATVDAHRRAYGLADAGPAIIDRDHALVRAVGPHVTPEAALYSSGGRLYRGRIDDWYVDIGRSRRQPTQHDLRARLEAALAGRSIAPRETEAVGCFIANP
jgi:hypothetical protein